MEQQQYKFEYDLADIFRNVWGYTAFPYFFRVQNAVEKALFGRNKGDNEEYDFVSIDRGEDTNSCLGVPFYAQNNNGKKMFMPIWLIKPNKEKILLQNTVSSLTNKKTIVETPLVNRQGTVKEEISVCDWEMNVKGIAVGATPDQYPETEIQELIDLYKMGVSLGIQNVRSAMAFYGEGGTHELGVGDEMVVIKDLRLPEIQGRKNCQAFEFNLVSDLAFDLYIE